MATSPSATPIYHDPRPTRNRRSSSRKSLASLSRSASHIDTPRTACPKDSDAFSYNPVHLRAWLIPQDLWDRLPAPVQSSLAAVQHSGAAVLTMLARYSRLKSHLPGSDQPLIALGFERLDKQAESASSSSHESKVPMDELLMKLEDLPLPKFRTVSNASSVVQSDISSPITEGSSGSQSQSECASPMTSFSSTQAVPVSPISLGPPELFSHSSRSRDRSFSTPLEPHDAYFATELSHLHTEALPRLRHKCHKVDTEWHEAKRAGNFTTDVMNDFENCWAEKKCLVLSLNEKCKRLANAHCVSSTGMGWAAS
ncbi:hypothetical protein LEMA_P106240.1 [Plenodomus lingam JN3]|uniref:Uncharacterized protein n=1 Tax=Leptosphaeria maculans (strain JN3 / isolate v23.1.3 / race Av1-4-5-6-7-8) TaxID=985895 RepID=E5A1M9_LEPMJ|nr:hypothetical protein LEMA_P106240.1 [Plenodomus lingam JN3]CBX97493.1 hypothetical protein LEMA_P106240.1 [Plenodomus lingam JN3]